MPQDTYGFIYLVTHIPTNRKYIGKKVLYFERNVKLGKRELNELKVERYRRKSSPKEESYKRIRLENLLRFSTRNKRIS